jgi:hypothetical protein
MRMRGFQLALATALLIPVAASADPYYDDFFHYEEPRLPVGGDCEAIAAAIGPGATWHGEFSGKHYDNFTDQYSPFAAFGCFESQYACQVWQHQALTYIGRGPLYYTTCRPGSSY